MVPKRHPAVVAMAKITYVTIALLLPIVGATALVFSLSRDASAQGPCGTPHDAMDSEEFAFLAELQAWRDSHLQYPSAQLVPSGPLNAAAAWQAEYLAHDPFTSNGHIDGEGRNWAERAEDCGYHPFWSYGSGEGVFALAGPNVADVPLSDFVDGVLYPGSGATADFPSSPTSPPFRCAGVAKFHQQDPPAIAWIVILAQYPSVDCPETQVSPIETGETPMPTLSPTPTLTPSPTPIPTPDVWHSWAPGLATE